jgi:hypothetical protein
LAFAMRPAERLLVMGISGEESFSLAYSGFEDEGHGSAPRVGPLWAAEADVNPRMIP